jgi:DNA polymerase-3 subunit epsilon
MSESEQQDLPMTPDESQSQTEKTKWIVFDTETTGLFDYKKRAHEPGQPRMAEITMIWTDTDLNYVGKRTLYIKPDGWYMPPHVGKINGLTTDFLHAEGVPVKEALDLVTRAVKAGYAFAAHNVAFDSKVLRGELRRAGMPDLYDEMRVYCTQVGNVGVCKLRNKNGGAKMPKLSEALAHCKIDQMDAHSSPGDAFGVLAIMRRMTKAGIDITPRLPEWKEND